MTTENVHLTGTGLLMEVGRRDGRPAVLLSHCVGVSSWRPLASPRPCPHSTTSPQPLHPLHRVPSPLPPLHRVPSPLPLSRVAGEGWRNQSVVTLSRLAGEGGVRG